MVSRVICVCFFLNKIFLVTKKNITVIHVFRLWPFGLRHCSLMNVSIFGGTCCLHLQDRTSTLKMKTASHKMSRQEKFLLLVLY
jgi:hypothetical protein